MKSAAPKDLPGSAKALLRGNFRCGNFAAGRRMAIVTVTVDAAERSGVLHPPRLPLSLQGSPNSDPDTHSTVCKGPIRGGSVQPPHPTNPSTSGKGFLGTSPPAPLHPGVGIRHRPAGQQEAIPGFRTPDLPLASASTDMIGWGRVLLSHTLDAARSY